VTQSGGSVNPSPDAFIIDDVLEDLVGAVSAFGTLFVIGAKNAHSASLSSSAIVLRGHYWKQLFERLSRGARCIVIIPGETPSLLDEISTLVQRRLTHR
jgi:hypothetical protein